MSRPRIIGWLLVFITLLAYLPVLNNGFVNFDDGDYVTENPVVLQGVSGQGLRWAFTTWHASNWHPLTWLSHMVDCQLFRLNPAGHHLVNLLFHAANAGLLFVLWRRMTGTLWPSAVVAALFAWHPLHVESVAWVSERKDVLSTFFAFLALLSYVHWATAAKRRAYYWLAWLCFALGLMAKPMLVTLPFVMLLLDYWPLRRTNWRSLVLEKWPFFTLTVGSCIVTFLAQRSDAVATLSKFSLGLRLENVMAAYATYLAKTIWPMHLAVFYPLMPPGAFLVALAVVVLAVISALALLLAKSRPYFIVGWLWFLGMLVPVIGLLQVGDQALADRYTYFPLIGIFGAVTWAAVDLAGRFPGWRRVLPVAAVAGLAGCLAGTEVQLRYWRNSETLFAHALAVTPDNPTARLNLGEAYQEEHRFAEAVDNYRHALTSDRPPPEVYNNLGRLLNDQGQPAEALDYCRQAVALNPRSPASRNGLGIVLTELGRYDEALAQFSEAMRLDPGSATFHFQSGRVLLKMARGEEARAQFREALRLNGGNLGMMIYIARVLAADPDPQARDGVAALALAAQVMQLAGPGQPVALDTLAMACAESGRFEDATNYGRHAVALALANGLRADATNMQQRLDLYEKHVPARLPAP